MDYQNDLEQIALQEKTLRFSSFNEEIAWAVGSKLRQVAKERDLAIAADIYANGLSLFGTALHGARPDNVEWVRRKRNLVLRMHTSSYASQLRLELAETTLNARSGLSARDFAAAGGSFPLIVSDIGAIGAITVSGLTSRQDHNLVVEVLCAHFDIPKAELLLAD